MRARLLLFGMAVLFMAPSCADHKHVGEKEVVETPVDIDAAATDIIETTLDDAQDSNKHLPNFSIYDPSLVAYFYKQSDYNPLWSKNGVFLPFADSLYQFIYGSRLYGLFPNDYHASQLLALRNTLADTANEAHLDASKWAEADLYLTASFINIIKDLKKGRLVPDSISKRDTALSPNFYFQHFNGFGGAMHTLANGLEPAQPGYARLKAALPAFLKNANLKNYTYVNGADSSRLRAALAKRLSEDDTTFIATAKSDSGLLSAAIKKYQAKNDLKLTGKSSTALVAHLNNTPLYRFKQLAVNMDRYKQLQPLPQQYIWVNIPSYQLQLWDSGAIRLTSKVVVGKPETRTPQLTSAISDLITYPKWHIPQSIIKKEILPALKRDPQYLARKGFSLVDGAGNEVDPNGVNWAKYENAIPYTVVQGSGDANALGVLKFNFPNKYAVYLHDTNQRYLFAKERRALSHGCVRVQAWEDLALYILDRDASLSANAVPVDSMLTWLALKEKHQIPVRNRLPVFIRYFTADVIEGDLLFYDDIYDEDRKLILKYFKTK